MSEKFQKTRAFLLELNLIYATNGGNFDKIKIDKLRRKHHIGSVPYHEVIRFVGREITDNLVQEYMEIKKHYANVYNKNRSEKKFRQTEIQVTEQPKKADAKYMTVCFSISPRHIENVSRIAKFECKAKSKIIMEALDLYFANWNPQPQTPPTLNKAL